MSARLVLCSPLLLLLGCVTADRSATLGRTGWSYEFVQRDRGLSSEEEALRVEETYVGNVATAYLDFGDVEKGGVAAYKIIDAFTRGSRATFVHYSPVPPDTKVLVRTGPVEREIVFPLLQSVLAMTSPPVDLAVHGVGLKAKTRASVDYVAPPVRGAAKARSSPPAERERAGRARESD